MVINNKRPNEQLAFHGYLIPWKMSLLTIPKDQRFLAYLIGSQDFDKYS